MVFGRRVGLQYQLRFTALAAFGIITVRGQEGFAGFGGVVRSLVFAHTHERPRIGVVQPASVDYDGGDFAFVVGPGFRRDVGVVTVAPVCEFDA